MLLRFFSFHGDFNFLHKLHSHFRLQVWFGSYSSCAVADRVLIKSESHSGSVNMHSCAFFFLPGFLPAVLQARERESSAGVKSLFCLAHTLIPPDNPPHHSTADIIHISRLQIQCMYEWTRVNAREWKRGERDLIELWLHLHESFHTLLSPADFQGIFFAAKRKALVCSRTTHFPHCCNQPISGGEVTHQHRLMDNY